VFDKGVPFVKKRIVHNEWRVSFYEEFESVLFPENNTHAEIEKLIDFAQKRNIGQGFRREIVIDAYPFLCAVRPEEKGIYIGTRRLSRELALLKLYEVNPVLIDQEAEKQFFKLKEHIERLSTLSSATFPSEIEWVTHVNDLPQFL